VLVFIATYIGKKKDRELYLFVFRLEAKTHIISRARGRGKFSPSLRRRVPDPHGYML